MGKRIAHILTAALVIGGAFFWPAGQALAGTAPNLLDDNRTNAFGHSQGLANAQYLNGAVGSYLTTRFPLGAPYAPLVYVQPRVIAHPKIHAIYMDTNWDANTPLAPSRAQLDGLVQKVITSGYFNGAQQYGVSTPTFTGSNQGSSICMGHAQLPGTSHTSNYDELNMMTCEAATVPYAPPFSETATFSGVPVADNDTIFIGFLPPNDITGSGCGPGQATAYHGFSGTETLQPFPNIATQTFPFAIIQTNCDVENGVVNMDSVSRDISHELIEAATDPFAAEGWLQDAGLTFPATSPNTEAADVCTQKHQALGTIITPTGPLTVGNYWSNRDGGCINGLSPVSGIVYANQRSTDNYTPSDQRGSPGSGPFKIGRQGTGMYKIQFTNLASAGGTLQVAAVDGDGSATCKAVSWHALGSDEMANVACFNAAGVPTDHNFSASFTSAIQPVGLYGYAYANQPALRAWYSPAATDSAATGGGQIRVSSRGFPGRYVVEFPNVVGVPLTTAQATAVGNDANYCAAAGWQPNGAMEDVFVDCQKPNGQFADTAFTVSFGRQTSLLDNSIQQFAYFLANQSHTDSYYPDPLYWNATQNFGYAQIDRLDVGSYQISFPIGNYDRSKGVPFAAATAPPDQQFGRCEVDQLTLRVSCTDANGQPADQQFIFEYEF